MNRSGRLAKPASRIQWPVRFRPAATRSKESRRGPDPAAPARMRTKDDARPSRPARRPRPRLVRGGLPGRADPGAAAGLAGDRRGRAPLLCLADRHGQDARRVPRDPRRGSIASTRPARSRPGCGASTSRRCGASATTSSGTWREPLEAIRELLGPRREPGPRRRPDGRHLGLSAREAPRRPAAPADHDAREPVADAQPVGLARALARASSTSSSTRSTRSSRPSAGPTWRSRSNGSPRRPRPTRSASASRRPAGRPSRSRGSWSGRRGPAGSSRHRARRARRALRSRSSR